MKCVLIPPVRCMPCLEPSTWAFASNRPTWEPGSLGLCRPEAGMSPPPRRGRARLGGRAGGARLPGISPPSQPSPARGEGAILGRCSSTTSLVLWYISLDHHFAVVPVLHIEVVFLLMATHVVPKASPETLPELA